MSNATRVLVYGWPLLALMLGGCDDQPAPAPTRALERPESVSFFCWDRTTREPVELERCLPDPDTADEEDTDVAPASPAEPFELHAAVTQTATGEVAAIQVTGDREHPAGVIDSDVRIPLFTFAPVGDLPSAVVTPSDDPTFTYVVSRGSSELHVIETSSFRNGLGAVVRAVERDGGPFFLGPGSRPDGGMPPSDGGLPADGGGMDGGAPSASPVGRPSAMVLNPDEDELIIAVPEFGEVWFVPIDGGTVGDPIRVPLTTTVPAPVDLTAIPAGDRPPTYQVTCETSVLDPEPVAPRDPITLGPTPRPWALAVDADNGRVLVADRALPVIHAIDLETHTEVTGINVGTPTRAVVLTPPVPARSGDTERTDRFLYAVDETNNSVLAVDYTDTRASFGAVLTVSSNAPQDRLAVPFPARAIEVATPAWPETGGLPACDPEEVSPAVLRGVFLAVATTDGRVRIFDIFDLDAPCRGVTCGGGSEVDSEDEVVAIGRHRPRIGAFIEADEPVDLDPPPTWNVSGATSIVDDESGSAGDRVPGLVDLDACPDGLGPVFGDSDAIFVCAVTDPWAATSQQYVATWEGSLPSTTMTGASFDPAEPAVDVRFNPCELGVLGSANVPDSGELGNYGGDVVAITSPLPPSTAEDERCRSLVQVTDAGQTSPVLIPLISASAESARPTYAGRLVLGERTADGAFTLEEVRACFPELVELEVRARGVFVVQSSRAGFRHAVVSGSDGVCEMDPAAVARGENGRAFPGRLFQTPEVAFQLDDSPAPDGARLSFTTADVPLPLAFDISFDASSMTDVPSLIADLEFNEIDQRLYVVEQASRGLVRVDLIGGGQIENFFQ